MKAPLKQERERAARLLAAAIAIEDYYGPDANPAMSELRAAIDAVKSNASPAGASNVIEMDEREAALAKDPNAFFCPHCGAARPPYGWHFNIGDTGPFALQWLTCYCGECKEILSVIVPPLPNCFLPKQELVEQLKKQFGSKITM